MIFSPQFGIANLYKGVRQNALFVDFKAVPTVKELEPIVNSVFRSYMARRQGRRYVARPLDERPIADILVRVPDPAAPEDFSRSTYKVLPRSYVPDPEAWECGPGQNQQCTLAAQLRDLTYLDDKGLVESPSPSDPWHYHRASERLNALVSENSGDIVLLANMKQGYHFAPHGIRGNHGSLTAVDGMVPIAVTYPGSAGDSSEDSILSVIRSYLSQAGAREAEVIRRFFGIQ